MKQHNLPARRKAALRWMARALLVLLLLLWLGPRCLTPAAANRQELSMLAESPEIVCQTAGPEDTQLLYSWNDDYLCLGAYYRWRPWEWNCRSRQIVEREAGRPFAAGVLDIHLQEGSENPETRWRRVWSIFGSIEDERVSVIRVEFEGDTGDGWEADAVYRETVELTVADMERHEEKPWFLCEIKPTQALVGWGCVVKGFSADGENLGTLLALLQEWE